MEGRKGTKKKSDLEIFFLSVSFKMGRAPRSPDKVAFEVLIWEEGLGHGPVHVVNS